MKLLIGAISLAALRLLITIAPNMTSITCIRGDGVVKSSSTHSSSENLYHL